MANGSDFVVNALNAQQNLAPNGQPYWFGRAVMEVLAYKDWRDFRDVLEKAKTACDLSGHFSSDHFVLKPEMVDIGSGAKRERENYILSRYACYLIAMNGDSAKPEIATAQTYFAEQTYKQERMEIVSEEERRQLLRDRVKDANRKLAGAAKSSGVRNKMFGVFQDAGYKGLYGGDGVKSIKQRKGIPETDDLLDCIGRAELAANEFRITQTEEKLRIDSVIGETAAINTHHAVGKKVRKAIQNIGGVMPENLKAEPSIKKLAASKAKRKSKPLGNGI